MARYDEWYDKWMSSSMFSACIVRVTNQCNQRCKHCAFRSGPDQTGQLSVETCGKINAWVPKNVVLNIMGGEFSILDNYPEMLVAMTRGRPHVRLVTNGFWAGRDTEKFLDTMLSIKDTGCCEIDVAVSDDSWHEVDSSAATRIIGSFSHVVNPIKVGEIDTDDITPIGSAWDNGILPKSETVCSCETMCNMVITEGGMLGRCPYGYFPWKHFSETTWSDAQEYIWGWRSEKLTEGMNCLRCMETVQTSIVQCGQSGRETSRGKA